ncbi:hypothetical protein PYS58_23025 [Chryseobacterium indologenes]|uniref:hypothetical protein n=1 Tax=Chryseobacterium indologenes TaxID=253 RepID=UPI0023E861D6|nr:hypothetical protein [Chryseobacterium indologenes]WET49392.1 hypothetical protein PYS58_23025 [Chryseobacterium indologenes]
MGSRGIISAKTEASKSYVAVERNDYHYVEVTSLSTGVTVFVDETCLDTGTVDPKSTIQKTKWIVIEEVVWQELLSDHRKETKRESWGDSVFFEKIKKHVWGQFAGGKVNIKVSGLSSPYTRGGSLTEGNVYLIIPYTHYPEFRYKGQVIKLVYLTEPYVRYVYIDPPTAQEADVPIGYDNKLHLYGMKANINISTHLLPDFRKIGKAPVDKNICNIIGTVFFVNDAGEEITVGEFNSKIDGVEGNYNNYQQIKLLVDPAWREAEGVHQKNHQPQKYFVKIMATAMNLSLNLNSDPKKPYDFTENIKNIFHPKSYNTNKDFTKWYKFDGDQEDWIELPMQPHIEVRWDTMEMIYKQLEIEKNNQIQYIGDIPYTKKEFDPCGYSSITITEEFDPSDQKELDEKLTKAGKDEKQKQKVNDDFANKKRKPLVIFDENEKIIDNTQKIFDVTTGGQKKSISIKLGGLNNKQVLCKGLLLAKGQKHDDKKNVFQIEHLVYSALKLTNGEYQKEVDTTHKQQLENSNIPVTKDNKTDYDVIQNPDNSKIKVVREILNFKENEDYTFIGEDEIKLNIGYRYIKHLTTFNKEINPNVVGQLFEEAWLFNYFLLDYNKQKQMYYLPISTCRYSNQIAKINVLPDIKWTLLFKFNFKEEDWQKFEDVHSYQVGAFLIVASETTQTTTPRGTTTTSRSAMAAGVSISRETTRQPVQREGGIKRLLELLKKVEVSLIAEWKDEAGKKQKKDVIEGFFTPIYGFFKKLTDITKMISAITEGESNEEDREKKKLLDAELKKVAGNRDAKEVVGGIYDILTAKTVESKMIYPSIGLAVSWYYGDAYKKDAPEFNGRKALEYNLQLKANPIVGYGLTLDFLEMLAKKHPIAYIIIKVVQVGMYLAGKNNKINVTLAINGTLNIEGNMRYNTLTGSSFSNHHSAKKEKMASLTGEIEAILEGSIDVRLNKYQIITEFNASGSFKLGVKTKIIPGAHLATDTEGMFYETDLDYEGVTFYLKAEGKAEFLFFGMKIFEWEDSYEPEPWTVGKGYIASEKHYLIQ